MARRQPGGKAWTRWAGEYDPRGGLCRAKAVRGDEEQRAQVRSGATCAALVTADDDGARGGAEGVKEEGNDGGRRGRIVMGEGAFSVVAVAWGMRAATECVGGTRLLAVTDANLRKTVSGRSTTTRVATVETRSAMSE
jgi:hypothetical protein